MFQTLKNSNLDFGINKKKKFNWLKFSVLAIKIYDVKRSENFIYSTLQVHRQV